jgi:hypothetical protein
VAILLSGDSQSNGTMQVTAPSEAAGLIDQVHAAGITLTYDPDTRTLRTGDISIAAIAVGQAD